MFVEYAKDDSESFCVRISVVNRGPEAAQLDLLPTLWFRNTWSWSEGGRAHLESEREVRCQQSYLGVRRLYLEGSPELLFTENETNFERIYDAPNGSSYVKDGIDDYVVHGCHHAVNPAQTGTKMAARYSLDIGAGETKVVRLRFAGEERGFDDFDSIFTARIAEADEFYRPVCDASCSEDLRSVQRQAFAGMLWSKQFYCYDVKTWLQGDPGQPNPPGERKYGRNRDWKHLYNSDVLSMPDKWEYPWYAAWDLAFHCLPLALVDSEFAKEQLILLLREWYMHPSGQIPAYEWALGDVNPPVHAWAALRVFKIERKRTGVGDREFLERIFHKLMLNFTWWVNRKDTLGNNLFEGGFLGLDNIGVFDRSAPLPVGGVLEQSDGTGWMAMYTLNLLAIALELAREDPAYEDVASKFFEHFVHITEAMNHIGADGYGLWDEEDGFYYDVLRFPDGSHRPIKIRSVVGYLTLFAVEILEPDVIAKLPGFHRRMEWFLNNNESLKDHIDEQRLPDGGVRRLLAVVNLKRLRRVLSYVLDESEFLSPNGSNT